MKKILIIVACTLLSISILYPSNVFYAQTDDVEGVVNNIQDTTNDSSDLSAVEDNIPNIPLNYIDDGLDGDLFLHKKKPLLFATPLESSYSSRNEGYTTSVKNQNPYGTCWSFAAVASAETNYAKENSNTKLDLSEYQLAWFALNNYGIQDKLNLIKNDGMKYLYGDTLNAGGNQQIAMFALASGIGFSNESLMPYPGYGSLGTINNDYCYYYDYYLRSTEIISMSESDKIKQAIKRYGALAVSYSHYPSSGSGFYDYYGINGDAYFHSTVLSGSNHAVTLVGWDDNYSRDNFGKNGKPKPSNNGAWLIKNSWGSSFGDNGYFWISYEEGSLKNSEAYAYIIEKVDSSKDYNLYQYDGGENPGILKGDGTDIAISNKYTAIRNETVTDVGFVTYSAQVNYKIGIYEVPDGKNPFDPSASLKGEIQTGSLQNSGYHLIKLNTPVNIDAGKNFAAVIELSVSSGQIALGADSTAPFGDRNNYDEQHLDQSFIKEDGNVYDAAQAPLKCTNRIKVLCEKNNATSSEPTYKVEHYLQNIENDEYEILKNSFILEGTVGEEVSAEEKVYAGFELDETKSSSTKSGTVTEDGSLVLKLFYKRKSFQLTFNTNGGNPISPIEGKYESPITQPDKPIKEGYVFVGWDKEIPSKMPAENMEFTAEWAEYIPGEYKVSFFLQTITEPGYPGMQFILSDDTETYTDGVFVGDEIVIDESNAPVIEGFTFDPGSTLFLGKLSGIVTSSPILELTLCYTRNKYNLSFTKGEGIKTVVDDGSHYYEEEVSLYCEIDEGYEFDNYKEGTTELSNNSDYVYTIPSHDVTIEVNGKAINYSINYNLDSGTNNPSNPSTYTIKDNDFTIQNPTREGYFFSGWTSADILTPTKNIVISQGTIGDIELTANWISATLNLSSTFAENDVIYLDGKKLTVGPSVSIDLNNENSKQITKYAIENELETDVHLKYPSNMLAYFLEEEGGQIVPKHKENFDNIMIYEGASIRMTGKKGIRIITGIPTDKKNLLVNSNIDGYKVMEYGTVICWADNLASDEEPTLYLDTDGKFKPVHGSKGRAFSRTDGINAIFNESGGISRYTNTLVESSDGQWSGQCGKDFAMRSYIIICPTDSTSLDDYIVLYGGTLFRSVAYVAYQNRNTYTPGTDAYEYIWGLIKDGYGDTYDSEYVTE